MKYSPGRRGLIRTEKGIFWVSPVRVAFPGDRYPSHLWKDRSPTMLYGVSVSFAMPEMVDPSLYQSMLYVWYTPK